MEDDGLIWIWTEAREMAQDRGRRLRL